MNNNCSYLAKNVYVIGHHQKLCQIIFGKDLLYAFGCDNGRIASSRSLTNNAVIGHLHLHDLHMMFLYY